MISSLSVLGSTGSIGRQTMDILRKFGISACALTTNRNVKLLEEQAREFHPKMVAAFDENAARDLKIMLADTDIEVYSGMPGLIAAAETQYADMVLTAVVGMVGLLPTLAAIDAGHDIALANKETLVCGGAIVTERANAKKIRILPVDSEHSAIFQCLEACHDRRALERIILTASGGPFFGKQRDELAQITPSDALKHPNWNMGSKITIDSATLMNKGLEFIEAMWLFNVTPDQISIVVHRESIIHSMIEFCDGGLLAQLGAPDMRLPIAYALTYPERRDFSGPKLDFKNLQNLSFYPPDTDTFSCLQLAMAAARKPGTACAILNGANEAAVDLFLHQKIGFLEIADLVSQALDKIEVVTHPSVDDILTADSKARELVYSAKHISM